MLTTHQKSLDGNMAALDEYMREQDAGDILQARIDTRAKELIEIHTDDIDDMILALVEEHPEKAMELLTNMLGSYEPLRGLTENNHRLWFYNEFIPAECEKLAEEEFKN